MPCAVVVLDEQDLGVFEENGAQGTRARGGHRGARGVLRPVGDDQCARPGLQGTPYVVGQRTLVVDAHRDRAQPERRDEVEQAAPAGILHGDGVAGFEVGRQHPLDGVEGAGGDGDGPAGTPSASRPARASRASSGSTGSSP